MSPSRCPSLQLLFRPSTSETLAAPPISGNDTDRLALLSFKSLITDDPTQALASWNDSLHFCQWQGVTCGSRRHPQRVTSLDLESMNLEGQISPSISNLTFLRRLHLPLNRLHGTVPQELGLLSRLQHLILHSNSLEGEIPTTLTSRCTDLQNLSFGNNSLHGEIPTNLTNCSSLRMLVLAINQFTGKIPRELGSISSLEQLWLGRNDLSGTIPHELGNLSSLSILSLAFNNLEGGIPTNIGWLGNMEFLDLGNNMLSGSIPSSVYNLSNLWTFSLPNNRLVGTLPADIGHKLPNVQDLLLYGNQLEGELPLSFPNASGLVYLELNRNNFRGTVPSNLGTLQNLSMLELGDNQLELETGNGWSFLESLTNCSQFVELGLSGNNIVGVLPHDVGNLSGIVGLFFEQNRISGSIPSGIGNLVNLEKLDLGQNFLTGAIPDSIGMARRLSYLFLQNNMLSGKIPSSLGNLSELIKLGLFRNSLTGSIPGSFQSFQSLQFLFLCCNNLSSPLLRGIVGRPSSLVHLDLSKNSLSGPLPVEFGSMENLGVLRISYNKFSGQIPDLVKCQSLEYLLMGNNLFRGAIPTSLTNLKGLRELNLSNNNLFGSIPDFGSQDLDSLDLSFNSLEGQVPTDGIFKNLSAFSIIGNNRLCGGIQGLHLPECRMQAGGKKHIPTRLRIIIIVCPLIGVLCLICLLKYLIMGHFLHRNSRNSLPLPSFNNQCIRLSYNELLKATENFSQENLIGCGSFGSVYKGVLDHDQRVVAVKVLNLQQSGALKSFMSECDALKNIRHHNLVKVLTSCSGLDHKGSEFKALVFEFMPNGSLEDWLHRSENDDHGHKGTLNLKQGLNIAIDIAHALDYLHFHGEMPLVHCDLKPSNVLLDYDMVAHVGDFGLARFLPKDAGTETLTSSIGIKGTIGYIAPEYGMGGQISTCGDIYSYGILLLEMFTGKRPTDDIFKERLNLRKIVEMAFPEKVMSIIDPQLLVLDKEVKKWDDNLQTASVDVQDGVRECLVSVIKVGILCSKENPKDRMKMADVIKEMQAIRDKYLSLRIS